MTDAEHTCHTCAEPARLHCAGCKRVFCADHLERRFAMGYFYFCAECLARQEEALGTTAKPPARKKGTGAAGRKPRPT